MGALEEAPGHMAEEEGPAAAGAAAGPALKPRERSSGTVLGRPPAAAAVEDEATQSAKAPESDGNLLVVATTGGRCSIL